MIARKRAEGPVLVLEGGQSLSKLGGRGGGVSAHELEQRRIKAELIASAWAKGGLDAMALGPADWSLGAPFVRSLVEEHRLPVLAANLSCDGSDPYPSGRVFEQKGRKIGVVGVTIGTVEGCEVSDPSAALRAAVAELGPVDVTVALLPVDSDRALAQLDPQLPVDLVIDARGKFPQSGPEHRGDVWFAGAGSRGKHVGVLTLELVPGATRWTALGEEDRLAKQIAQAKARLEGTDKRIAEAKSDANRERFESQRAAYEKQLEDANARLAALEVPAGTHRLELEGVELGSDVPDEPEIAKLVAAAKARVTAATGADPGKFVARVVLDEASPYAGGQVCVRCHAPEHAQWSTTGHARAWQSLVRSDRALDEQCWGCHVTGRGQPGGPPDAANSGPWRDVQCEACHGPGRAHVAAPTEVELTKTPAVETCTTCHDGVQDDGRFDPVEYLSRVAHGAAKR